MVTPLILPYKYRLKKIGIEVCFRTSNTRIKTYPIMSNLIASKSGQNRCLILIPLEGATLYYDPRVATLHCDPKIILLCRYWNQDQVLSLLSLEAIK